MTRFACDANLDTNLDKQINIVKQECQSYFVWSEITIKNGFTSNKVCLTTANTCR